MGLSGKQRLDFAGRAHVSTRHIVGVDRSQLQPREWHPIRAERGQPATYNQPVEWFAGSVRAAIESDARLVRQKMALRVNCRTQVERCGMTRIACAQFVGVTHLCFHRSTGRFGEEVAGVLVEGGTFAAEVATDESAIDDDAFLRHANRARYLGA